MVLTRKRGDIFVKRLFGYFLSSPIIFFKTCAICIVRPLHFTLYVVNINGTVMEAWILFTLFCCFVIVVFFSPLKSLHQLSFSCFATKHLGTVDVRTSPRSLFLVCLAHCVKEIFFFSLNNAKRCFATSRIIHKVSQWNLISICRRAKLIFTERMERALQYCIFHYNIWRN